MSLWKRFVNLFRASAHGALDSVENVENSAELTIRDHELKVTQVRRTLASVIGTYRLSEQANIERLRELETMEGAMNALLDDADAIDAMVAKAESALASALARGDDAEVAKAQDYVQTTKDAQHEAQSNVLALDERKSALADSLRDHQEQYVKMGETVEAIKNDMRKMDSDLALMRQRKDSLVARSKVADAQEAMISARAEVTSISASTQFGAIEKKVAKREALNIGMREIDSIGSTSRVDELLRDTKNDARLAEIRASRDKAPKLLEKGTA